MSTNPAVTSEAVEGTVMAAIDESGPEARLVIADVERDGAWVSIPRDDAVAIER